VPGTIGDTEEECCESTCDDFPCACGYQAKPGPIVGIGRDEDICCEPTCEGYSCPSGSRIVDGFAFTGPPDESMCCEACPENCAECANASCNKCDTGFGFISGATPQCQECSATNCATCNEDPTKCDSCPPGHYFDECEGTCTECESDNCLSCSADLKCDACLPGFKFDPYTGTCSGCDAENCLTCCAETGQCDSCSDGHNLVDGMCVHCLVDGCQSCSSGIETCDKCMEGHAFDHTTNCCRPCRVSSCGTCIGSLDHCEACQDGFELMPNGICAQRKCTASRCAACSIDVGKCDACEEGWHLDWFHGTCTQCLAKNCKTCSADLKTCDSCPAGFEGDESGHCVATSPIPVGGQCAGLPAPYEFEGIGECGECIHWFGCDESGEGALGCLEKIMGEEKCKKDFFTYNERGDKSCGCKTSDEAKLVTHGSDLATCYRVTEDPVP